jgi:hypothetical protein
VYTCPLQPGRPDGDYRKLFSFCFKFPYIAFDNPEICETIHNIYLPIYGTVFIFNYHHNVFTMSLILKYMLPCIYLKCIANFESQKLLQNSMLWRSTCFYIVTFVYCVYNVTISQTGYFFIITIRVGVDTCTLITGACVESKICSLGTCKYMHSEHIFELLVDCCWNSSE